MTIKEFAEVLNNRECDYPQFTKEEIKVAKDNGFVIVYVSDDLIEFEGAICDEAGCFDGYEAYFNKNGVTGEGKNVIKALWCDSEAVDENENIIVWSYETDIPHETFMIYEYGEPYCRGIVFSIDDVN